MEPPDGSLSPGSFGDPIRGSFTEFQLKDTIVRHRKEGDLFDWDDFTLEHLWPPAKASADEDSSKLDYLAISYTWRSDDAKSNFDGEAIWLDDRSCSILITYNLSRCLRRIRNTSQVQRLWIDRLCINQGPSGTRDKEQQIPLMGKIYSQARGVLLWMGEHMDNINTPAAFDVIKRLHVAFQNVPHPMAKAFSLLRACNLSTIQHRYGLPSQDSHAWLDYYRFCRQRVFTRLWILQEVCLARCVGILCGDHLIDFRMLGESRDFLSDSEMDRRLGIRYDDFDAPNDSTPSRDRLCTTYLWLCRFRSILGKSQSLAVLLMESSVFNTDREFPQDRIFALLGLIVEELENDGSIPAALLPDYSKPYEQVLRDTVEFLLMRQSEDFLDVLSLAANDPCESKHFGPSWVSNFSAPRSFTLIATEQAKTGARMYVSAKQRSCTPFSKSPEIIDDNLILDGWMVDRIAVVCSFDSDISKTTQDLWLDQVSMVVDALSFLGAPYAAGDDVDPVDALWRTIVRDWAADDEEEGVDIFRRRFFHLVVICCAESVWSATKVHLGAKYGVHPEWVLRMAANSKTVESEVRHFLHNLTGPGGIDDEHSIDIDLDGLTGFLSVSSAAIKAARPGLWNLLYGHIFSRFGKFEVEESDSIIPVRHMMEQCARGHSFFVTKNGLFGLGPPSVQKGDNVYVLRGGRMPYVLRDKRGQGGSGHILIGESYVHGIKHGEVCEREGFAWDRVTIT